MIKLHSVLIFSLIATLFLLLPADAGAQVNPNCPSVYGASCPSGVLRVAKKVQNPRTGELMTATNDNFSPDATINFKVEVQNTGSADLNNVSVTDQFPRTPDLIDFVGGTGTFDSNARTLTWTINTLKAGETQSFDVQAKAKPQSALPNQNIICATNFVSVQQDQQTAQNSAGFCIQMGAVQGVSVKELPRTGAPVGLWLLSGILVAAGLWFGRFTLSEGGRDTATFIWENRKFIRKEGR